MGGISEFSDKAGGGRNRRPGVGWALQGPIRHKQQRRAVPGVGFKPVEHGSTLHRADQYFPSNAKIGLRCFHAPAVKSGNSNVWKPLAMDCSLSGVIALQVTAS